MASNREREAGVHESSQCFEMLERDLTARMSLRRAETASPDPNKPAPKPHRRQRGPVDKRRKALGQTEQRSRVNHVGA